MKIFDLNFINRWKKLCFNSSYVTFLNKLHVEPPHSWLWLLSYIEKHHKIFLNIIMFWCSCVDFHFWCSSQYVYLNLEIRKYFSFFLNHWCKTELDNLNLFFLRVFQLFTLKWCIEWFTLTSCSVIFSIILYKNFVL